MSVLAWMTRHVPEMSAIKSASYNIFAAGWSAPLRFLTHRATEGPKWSARGGPRPVRRWRCRSFKLPLWEGEAEPDLRARHERDEEIEAPESNPPVNRDFPFGFRPASIAGHFR